MKHHTIHHIIATVLMALCWGTSYAGDDNDNWHRACDRTAIHPIPLIEAGGKGKASLCVRSNRIKGSMHMRNLESHSAYTVWWVYFDKPSACTGTTPLPALLQDGTSQCEFDDFFGDKPQAIFGRMDSGVSPRNGRLRFQGTFRGMQPSNNSEIWLLVFGHGKAAYRDGAALARQLLTPEDPGVGAPHLGNIIDGQLGYPIASAVFKVH